MTCLAGIDGGTVSDVEGEVVRFQGPPLVKADCIWRRPYEMIGPRRVSGNACSLVLTLLSKIEVEGTSRAAMVHMERENATIKYG